MTDGFNYEEMYDAVQAELVYTTRAFEKKIEQDRLHHIARVEELEKALAEARAGNGGK